MMLFGKKPRKVKSHQDMRTDGKYSIFLGSIDNELELDEYMMRQFSKDFGFAIYEPDGPEAAAAQKTSVAKLLEGFSNMGHPEFKQAAVDLAKSKGIDEAACAIVFYNFEYDPALTDQNGSGLVQFLGVVD